MNYLQCYLVSTFFLTVFSLTHAQTSQALVRSSIKEDIKRDWLKQMKPANVMPNTYMREDQTKLKIVREDDLLEFSKKYRKGTGGEEYEDKYSLDGLKKSLKTVNVPINKLPDGAVTHEFINGHWQFVNAAKRVDGLVVPSGISLSGWKKKKMSATAKRILENVFGMQAEE